MVFFILMTSFLGHAQNNEPCLPYKQDIVVMRDLCKSKMINHAQEKHGVSGLGLLRLKRSRTSKDQQIKQDLNNTIKTCLSHEAKNLLESKKIDQSCYDFILSKKTALDN